MVGTYLFNVILILPVPESHNHIKNTEDEGMDEI